MDVKNYFAEVLTKKRKEKGYTQDMVAAVLELSRISIVNMERGNNMTTLQGLSNKTSVHLKKQSFHYQYTKDILITTK